MKKRKVLPVGSAKVKFSQDYAFITSTMYSDESFQNWILNNLIQVYYTPKKYHENKYELSFYYMGIEVNPINNIPLFDHQVIKMNLIKECKINILNLTKKLLDEDYYVTNTLDEFYLSIRSSYKKEHKEHGILIYGYDDYTRMIYTAGYDARGHFNCNCIPYDIYTVSFQNTQRNSRISCFRRNSFKCDIDIELIKDLLKDFYKSFNTSTRYRMIRNPIEDSVWGLNAFSKLCDEKDEKYYYMLYEYVMLMKMRANKFMLFDIEEKLNDLNKEAQILQNLLLKSYFNKEYRSDVEKKTCAILEALGENVQSMLDRM